MLNRWIWIAAVLLPVVAIALWWQPVASHPFITAISLAIYGMAWTIGRQLGSRWQDRVVDQVDRRITHWLSGFGRRYRQFVLDKQCYIDLKGLTTIDSYTPKLDDVFVDLALAPRPASLMGEGVLDQPPEHVTESLSVANLIDRDGTQILAVLGVPGSGKTTLLRHTARQVGLNSRRRLALRRLLSGRRRPRRTVPMVVHLRDHVEAIEASPDLALAGLLRGTLGRLAAEEPTGWFERQLFDGRCVVLLDGLDEVAQHERRQIVADWIEDQTAQYPNNAYLITSRPRAYRKAPINGAAVLQVRGFTPAQVARFVHAFYLAAEKHSNRLLNDHTRQQAETDADDLLEKIRGTPALNELAVNPLLLTMIANVHRVSGAMPGSRVELYREICQVMLWRRHEAKKLRSTLSGPRKQALLRNLAFIMMQESVRDLPRERILAAFADGLRRMPGTTVAEDLFADVRHHGLIKLENGRYSFAHQTFQEYLAAVYIRDKKELSAELLDQVVNDSWWRETIALYAALSDADPIVRACLASGGVTALALAFDCAESHLELAPELRQHLDELLVAALTPRADPELRRLMIRVVINRELRHLVRTDDGGRVRPRPVSEGMYRLYRLDRDGIELADPGRTGHEHQPIIGIDALDAVTFTRWVNDITDGEPGYRLATRAELDDPAVKRALPVCSAWIAPGHGGGRPDLWTPTGISHPHTVNAATLRRHLRADVERAMPTLARLLLVVAGVALRHFERARSTTSAIGIEYIEEFDRSFYHESSPGFDLASNLTAMYDRTRGIAGDLRLAIDTAHAVDPTMPLDYFNANDRVGDLDNELILRDADLAIDSERALEHLLGQALGTTGVGTVDRVIRHDRALLGPLLGALPGDADDTGYERALELVLGKALAGVLTSLRGSAPDRRAAQLRQALSMVAGIQDTRFVVAPSRLPDLLRDGCAAMRTVAGSWADRTAAALADLATPVVTRQRPLTEDAATAIRLGAVCLAVEAALDGMHRTSDQFTGLAAGVTFLQLRAGGETPPSETIILAAT